MSKIHALSDSAAAIRARWPHTPRVAIILGTGLGSLANQIEVEAEIPYAKIPGFPRSTALSHAGRLVCGKLAGVSVVAMQGRCHLYEGYSRDDVALTVQVLAALKAELLIVSNASGGLNPKYSGGDILVIEDHLDLMFQGIRRTPNAVAFGDSVASQETADGAWSVPATISPAHVYDHALIEQALAIARRENFVAHRGVYAALAGPSYETRAEYRCLRRIGADVVGMSTVPEVQAAAVCGLRVLALSVVTNVACPDAPRKTSGEEVVALAAAAEPKLRKIVLDVVSGT